MFQSPQIILAVLDLGQHWFLHSHLKIWLGLSGVALGTLRLSSHSKFIKIDGFFGALDTWKSSECGLWILNVLTRPASFLKKEPIFAFYSECREKIVLNWWQKRYSLKKRRKECPFWVGLVFAFLVCFFHFLGLRSLRFFSISVLYSDRYDCLIGIAE